MPLSYGRSSCVGKRNETTAGVQLVRVDERRETGNEKRETEKQKRETRNWKLETGKRGGTFEVIGRNDMSETENT